MALSFGAAYDGSYYTPLKDKCQPAAAPAAQAALPDEPADARGAPVRSGDAPGQSLWQPVTGTPPPRPSRRPAGYTIPLRTPFVLTGSVTDPDGDTMVFSWEQNDRGGAAGTSLLSNAKVDGALFAMFPKSAQFSDPLIYNSPDANALTSDPTRVLPDLEQILDNNTNADSGACPVGPIAPPVPVPANECFAEFLPTSDYVGVTGVNANPLSLHFRFTARDGEGGVNAADTTLLLANTAGPFLVTAPNTAVTWTRNTAATVTWNVANTAAAPVSCAAVDIDLSVDGGLSYPTILAAGTPNDGTENVVVPYAGTTEARVRVTCANNIFFDVSNADFTIAPVACYWADINCSCGVSSTTIDVGDILAVADAWNVFEASGSLTPAADVDCQANGGCDGVNDIVDVGAVASEWGTVCPEGVGGAD